MLKIEYPSGFGPENNLPLDTSNSFMFDIPAGYIGTFSSNGTNKEKAICIYSMSSGSKFLEVLDFINGTVPNIHNNSQMIYSYLCTAWHKDPSEGKWKQTNGLHVRFMGYRSENYYEILVSFTKNGDPYIGLNITLSRINYP
ncbi:hypothetical protein COJ51_02215 [Bacillus thuringiensis]|uniref:hypothetical protein n=1 Tax=Bacillus thuringiensis TaxID=1428 RepID=UPI000BF708E6|nr:hypothetical protein [Bacillus thuringiensis]PFN11078.1 hypothetical protein COJ51_02215 [Bacillus thuringiensis]